MQPVSCKWFSWWLFIFIVKEFSCIDFPRSRMWVLCLLVFILLCHKYLGALHLRVKHKSDSFCDCSIACFCCTLHWYKPDKSESPSKLVPVNASAKSSSPIQVSEPDRMKHDYCFSNVRVVHFQDSIQWGLNLSSVHRTDTFLLPLWIRCLLNQIIMKSGSFDGCFSSFFVFTIQIEFRECCVCFQCFAQWFDSCVSKTVA